MAKNKTSGIVSLICFIIVALIVLVTCSAAESNPKPSQVEAKYERDGRCFVEIWVEVTPEEYIGLDVGDEFVR